MLKYQISYKYYYHNHLSPSFAKFLQFFNFSLGRSQSIGTQFSSKEGYSCEIGNQGMRILEFKTVHDCRDCDGGDTCKGGPGVAYIKCKCTRNGKYIPWTTCWRPGMKVEVYILLSCIPKDISVATISPWKRYYINKVKYFITHWFRDPDQIILCENHQI